jgi:rhodanese-related sulfurtransferase
VKGLRNLKRSAPKNDVPEQMDTRWPALFLVLFVVLLIVFALVYRQPRAMTPREAYEAVHERQIQAVVDVRTPEEYAEGHYHDSIHMPLADLPATLPRRLPERGTTILFVCKTGRRAAAAARLAHDLGYRDVFYLEGAEGRDLERRYRFQ